MKEVYQSDEGHQAGEVHQVDEECQKEECFLCQVDERRIWTIHQCQIGKERQGRRYQCQGGQIEEVSQVIKESQMKEDAPMSGR
jgi:hypothetical protein